MRRLVGLSVRSRLVLCCLLFAGSAAAIVPAVTRGVARHHNASSRRHATHTAAEDLLGKLGFPAGARIVSSDQSRRGELAAPALHVAFVHLVDVHRFWWVPGRACKVMSWIDRHPPAGAELTTSLGSAPNACRLSTLHVRAPGLRHPPPAAIGEWGAMFRFHSTKFPMVALIVKVVAAHNGGTAVRLDAQVAPPGGNSTISSGPVHTPSGKLADSAPVTSTTDPNAPNRPIRNFQVP